MTTTSETQGLTTETLLALLDDGPTTGLVAEAERRVAWMTQAHTSINSFPYPRRLTQ